MWFLAISIACPDYKRPCVDSKIYFFETKQEALDKLKECKISFICDFDTSEDHRIETLSEDSPDELVEELFETISDIDNFYRNSYMDQDPFYSNISEIHTGMMIKI